jgi:hypothetical protein
LIWQAVTGATSYSLAYSTSTTDPWTNIYNITNAYYSFTSDLLSDQTYYWQVRAVVASTPKDSSIFSKRWSFSTSTGIPIHISPANSSVGLVLTPTLDWSDVTGAVSYTLQYSTTYDFSSGTTTITRLTNSAYTFPSNLSTLTWYYWRVKTVFARQSESDYSIYWSFRTYGTGNWWGKVTTYSGRPFPGATVHLQILVRSLSLRLRLYL